MQILELNTNSQWFPLVKKHNAFRAGALPFFPDFGTKAPPPVIGQSNKIIAVVRMSKINFHQDECISNNLCLGVLFSDCVSAISTRANVQLGCGDERELCEYHRNYGKHRL